MRVSAMSTVYPGSSSRRIQVVLVPYRYGTLQGYTCCTGSPVVLVPYRYDTLLHRLAGLQNERRATGIVARTVFHKRYWQHYLCIVVLLETVLGADNTYLC